jgi:hypothetical protein
LDRRFDDNVRLRNWFRIEPIFFLMMVDVTVVDACEVRWLRFCTIKIVLAVFYCFFQGLEDFKVGLLSRIELLWM